MLLLAASLSGCVGNFKPATIPTTDFGTLATLDDTYQYTLTNVVTGQVLGISGQSQAAATNIVQKAGTTTTCTTASPCDTMWHFMPTTTTGQYVIENMLSHQVLDIASASTFAGAQPVQNPDTGATNVNWNLYLLSDGNYLIQNVNSTLYLQSDPLSTASPAVVDQGIRTTGTGGHTYQEWTLTKTSNLAYPAPMTVSGTGIYVHDPYIMQDPATHIYWLYGTHQTLAYSTDMSKFTYTTATSTYGACTDANAHYWLTYSGYCPIIGPDVTSWSGLQTPPADNNGNNIDVWAPDVLYYNGTYYQYYSIPYTPSTGAQALIGLTTSTTPYGPWTDKGVIITSWTTSTALPTTNTWGFYKTTTWNAIDPAPFVDPSGNWYLVFGSWQDGTRVVTLQGPNTTTTTANWGKPVSSTASTWTKVAYRATYGEEGPFIYPHVFNGTQYYYYFAPINVCCAGTASTYRTIVGRSTSPTGPYYDRGGTLLTAGGGTILVSSHANIYGPGGGSVFDDTGTSGTSSIPTFVYHYYDGNESGVPKLGISRLGFTSDGWPYLQ
jgi:arabinan endo-1,5-alpha-L-arabinosidase